MLRWIRPVFLCLLFSLPAAWLGCGLQHRSTDPAASNAEASRVIGGGEGGAITPATTCPAPLYGEAEWTRMSLVDVMVALRLELAEHASALADGHGKKLAALQSIDRTLRQGDDFGARQGLAGLLTEVRREAAANRADARFWNGVAGHLNQLLTLSDLPNRTINVSQGSEAVKGGLTPAFSLQCWQDCMNSRVQAIEAGFLECLGFDSLGHAIGVALKACIIGAVTAAIAAGVLTGGTASLPAALAGCFIGIDLEYHYCVGEFICKLAWAGARCWWNC